METTKFKEGNRKILYWVDDETFEGVQDGVYYKFLYDTTNKQFIGIYSKFEGTPVGEGLSGTGVVWATKQKIMDITVPGDVTIYLSIEELDVF